MALFIDSFEDSPVEAFENQDILAADLNYFPNLVFAAITIFVPDIGHFFPDGQIATATLEIPKIISGLKLDLMSKCGGRHHQC
ncbi:MAG: hypothetical protein K8F59_17045 [Rhodobacteraceae bacterium]|nr:hypothetical protein [Paracoccaceae bacterium]